MRLTIEMRLTFGIFIKLTVRHAYTAYAYAYAVYTKSHMRVSLGLVEGNFRNAMTDGQNWLGV